MDNELVDQIRAMIRFIEHEAPEVRIIQSNALYDGENANLFVYPPLSWDEEQCLILQDKIASHAVDVLVDHGYLILTYVYSPEQQVQAAKSQLDSAVKSAKSAKEVLSTAMDLGLLNKEIVLPDLTLA